VFTVWYKLSPYTKQTKSRLQSVKVNLNQKVMQIHSPPIPNVKDLCHYASTRAV
jgi:hypothetical protein